MTDFDSLVEDNSTPNASPQPVNQPLKFDDLKEDTSFDSLKDDSEQFKTPGQKIITAVEGLTGPLGTAFETSEMPDQHTANLLATNTLGRIGLMAKKVIGKVNPEDIAARQNANPEIHEISSMVGSTGAMMTMPEMAVAAEASNYAKIGAAALKGAIAMGAIQGGDEISKAMLGQGDPETPVATALAHVGAASLLGAGTFGTFKGAGLGVSKGLNSLENNKVGTKLLDFVSGLGYAASGEGALGKISSNKSFEFGRKAYSNIIKKFGEKVGMGVGAKLGGTPGLFMGEKIGEYIDKNITPGLSKKYAAPMIMKALSSKPLNNVAEIMDYASALNKGNKAITNGVSSVFGEGAKEAYSSLEKERDALKKYLDEGGINQQLTEQSQESQGFAKGGMVPPLNINQPTALEDHWPEQNILLNTARARISNYLNAQRPQTAPKLTYDNEVKNPQANREYDKVLNLAIKPLSILHKVKDGSLAPKDMAHFNAMYPELYKHLSKKITETMTSKSLDKDKKPPYKTRQALSLFLGTSLDSSLTPQSIQAAQMVFAQQKASSPAVKSNTGLETIGKSAMTAEQSRTQKLNKN